MKLWDQQISIRLGVLAFLIQALALGATGAEPSPSGMRLGPGIIIDKAEKRAYVMSENGVTAVSLSDGRDAWRSTVLAKPLGVNGSLLVTQVEAERTSNELQLAALDTRAAGRTVWTRDAKLPEEVEARLPTTLKSTFTAECPQPTDCTEVAWQYVPRHIGGRVPPQHEVELERDDNNAPSVHPLENALLPSPRSSAGGVIRGVVQLGQDPSSPNLESAVVGPGTHAFVEYFQVRPDVPLSGVPTPQFLSVDQAYILHSNRIADDRTWKKYQWSIYRKSDGAKVGSIRAHASVSPYYIDGANLILEEGPYSRFEGGQQVETPRQLIAINIHTGQTAWTHDIRDLGAKGPAPP